MVRVFRNLKSDDNFVRCMHMYWFSLLKSLEMNFHYIWFSFIKSHSWGNFSLHLQQFWHEIAHELSFCDFFLFVSLYLKYAKMHILWIVTPEWPHQVLRQYFVLKMVLTLNVSCHHWFFLALITTVMTAQMALIWLIMKLIETRSPY